MNAAIAMSEGLTEKRWLFVGKYPKKNYGPVDNENFMFQPASLTLSGVEDCLEPFM